MRRFKRPVSGSVAAWICVRAMARSSETRDPATLAIVSSAAIWSRSGGAASAAVQCTTPIGLPMIVTGTHTAEQPLPLWRRRCGQESRSSLLLNTRVWARRAAGQAAGDCTSHPGPTPAGPPLAAIR